jgi:hypothetical protein
VHAAWSGLSPSKHSSEKRTPPTTTSTTSSPSATSHSGRTSTYSARSVSFISPLFSQSFDEETFLFTGAGASRSPFQASDREAINAQHSRPLGGVEWRAAEQPPELAGQSDPLDDGYRTPPASPSRRLLSTGSVSSSPASSAPSAVGGGLAASNYSLHCELPLCLCLRLSLSLSLSLSLCRSVCDPQWAQQVWRRSHLHGRTSRAHRSSRGAKEQ